MEMGWEKRKFLTMNKRIRILWLQSLYYAIKLLYIIINR